VRDAGVSAAAVAAAHGSPPVRAGAGVEASAGAAAGADAAGPVVEVVAPVVGAGVVGAGAVGAGVEVAPAVAAENARIRLATPAAKSPAPVARRSAVSGLGSRSPAMTLQTGQTQHSGEPVDQPPG
jgi:hypothetical protein